MALLRRLFDIANRWPWLLPAASFAAGWLGFLLVRRGEELARIVALLALLGWVWLLIEPWVRRRLERRRPPAALAVGPLVPLGGQLDGPLQNRRKGRIHGRSITRCPGTSRSTASPISCSRRGP